MSGAIAYLNLELEDFSTIVQHPCQAYSAFLCLPNTVTQVPFCTPSRKSRRTSFHADLAFGSFVTSSSLRAAFVSRRSLNILNFSLVLALARYGIANVNIAFESPTIQFADRLAMTSESLGTREKDSVAKIASTNAIRITRTFDESSNHFSISPSMACGRRGCPSVGDTELER